MLIPQFSLRWLFGVTVICAVLFWIVRAGLRGEQVAALIALAVALALVMFSVYAIVFGALWLMTTSYLRVVGARRRPPSEPRS